MKTDKAALMYHLEGLAEPIQNVTFETAIYVIDVNAQFQAFTNLPTNFEELAYNLFISLPKTQVIHFVN